MFTEKDIERAAKIVRLSGDHPDGSFSPDSQALRDTLCRGFLLFFGDEPDFHPEDFRAMCEVDKEEWENFFWVC